MVESTKEKRSGASMVFFSSQFKTREALREGGSQSGGGERGVWFGGKLNLMAGKENGWDEKGRSQEEVTGVKSVEVPGGEK